MSLKEKIKNCDDIQKEIIKIEEWDNCVIEVRTITARERANILNEVVDEKGETDHGRLHAYMAVASCYDPDSREKIFDNNDIDWILNKSSGPINKIFQKAMDLSGMTKEAAEAMKKN